MGLSKICICCWYSFQSSSPFVVSREEPEVGREGPRPSPGLNSEPRFTPLGSLPPKTVRPFSPANEGSCTICALANVTVHKMQCFNKDLRAPGHGWSREHEDRAGKGRAALVHVERKGLRPRGPERRRPARTEELPTSRGAASRANSQGSSGGPTGPREELSFASVCWEATGQLLSGECVSSCAHSE